MAEGPREACFNVGSDKQGKESFNANARSAGTCRWTPRFTQRTALCNENISGVTRHRQSFFPAFVPDAWLTIFVLGVPVA